MICVTEKDKIIFSRDLALAIVRLSNGDIKPQKAERLAEKVTSTIDLGSAGLSHKGVNWLAKELIDNYDLSKIE